MYKEFIYFVYIKVFNEHRKGKQPDGESGLRDRHIQCTSICNLFVSYEHHTLCLFILFIHTSSLRGRLFHKITKNKLVYIIFYCISYCIISFTQYYELNYSTNTNNLSHRLYHYVMTDIRRDWFCCLYYVSLLI